LSPFSLWTVTLLEIGFFRCRSKPTTGRFKVSTSDSREPNAFQDLRSEKLLFSYFLIPTQILRKSKLQVNFSRIQKFLNFAVSSNMLLILLMPKPLLSITRFMFKKSVFLWILSSHLMYTPNGMISVTLSIWS
jgi:hypothetical protein